MGRVRFDETKISRKCKSLAYLVRICPYILGKCRFMRASEISWPWHASKMPNAIQFGSKTLNIIFTASCNGRACLYSIFLLKQCLFSKFRLRMSHPHRRSSQTLPCAAANFLEGVLWAKSRMANIHWAKSGRMISNYPILWFKSAYKVFPSLREISDSFWDCCYRKEGAFPFFCWNILRI